MKPRYSIQDAVMDVADAITHADIDDSPATIRTMINDYLDEAEKSGQEVNHGYDQERAVKRVQKRVKANLEFLERLGL